MGTWGAIRIIKLHWKKKDIQVEAMELDGEDFNVADLSTRR